MREENRPMKQKAAYLTALMILSLIAAGCGSIDPVTKQESLGYIPARFYDLLDMVELNLGVDTQFSLYVVAAVEPLLVGGGIYECEKLGMDGRLLGQWSEKRATIGLGPESFVQYEIEPNWANRYMYNTDYSPHKNTLPGEDVFYERWGFSPRFCDHEKRILDITAEVHVIALGIDVSVSPLEILDFITGWIGIDDISDDDWVDPKPLRRIPFFDEEEETVGEDAEAVINVEDENQG
jgi:hypothetical protein